MNLCFLLATEIRKISGINYFSKVWYFICHQKTSFEKKANHSIKERAYKIIKYLIIFNFQLKTFTCFFIVIYFFIYYFFFISFLRFKFKVK